MNEFNPQIEFLRVEMPLFSVLHSKSHSPGKKIFYCIKLEYQMPCALITRERTLFCVGLITFYCICTSLVYSVVSVSFSRLVHVHTCQQHIHQPVKSIMSE
jgi:hypothetical protein